MQIYKVEDLSNGREARKIPAYNKVRIAGVFKNKIKL